MIADSFEQPYARSPARLLHESACHFYIRPAGVRAADGGWFSRHVSRFNLGRKVMDLPKRVSSHGYRIRPLAACLASALTLAGVALGNEVKASTSGIVPMQVMDGRPGSFGLPRPDGPRTASIKPGQHAPIPARPGGGVTLEVTNCLDDGSPGTFRSTVNAAMSGDTVDLSLLSPCTITLATGFVDVSQTDLSITGPGPDVVTINGDGGQGVIQQLATGGGLSISGLTITGGKYQSGIFPFGGCLYTKANMTLINTVVTGCAAIGDGSTVAKGGGVYARGNLALLSSTVTSNLVDGAAANARGGGAYALGNLTVKYSTVSYNLSFATDPYTGVSAGLESRGSVYIGGSTISTNSAENTAAMTNVSSTSGASVVIVNSTISGNHSTGNLGGIYSQIPVAVYNSTIAFNVSDGYNAALFSRGSTLNLQSAIIADNESFGAPYDLGGFGGSGVTVTGSNDLITASSISVPLGTISSCPRLGPLADNGGTTKTHALPAESPAIDTGLTTSIGGDVDQRGEARPFGPQADIGAYEWQGGPSDRVFNSGFEAVCDM
jgi:hypothetical protein